MKKKIINTAVFFTILYWLSVYFLVFKHKIVIKPVTPLAVAVIISINGLLVLLSRFLVPVFDLVSRVTQKLGSMIFGLIAALVFYLILTPIGLFKRLAGKKLMKVKFDKNIESYYEEWEPGGNIEKQY